MSTLQCTHSEPCDFYCVNIDGNMVEFLWNIFSPIRFNYTAYPTRSRSPCLIYLKNNPSIQTGNDVRTSIRNFSLEVRILLDFLGPTSSRLIYYAGAYYSEPGLQNELALSVRSEVNFALKPRKIYRIVYGLNQNS